MATLIPSVSFAEVHVLGAKENRIISTLQQISNQLNTNQNADKAIDQLANIFTTLSTSFPKKSSERDTFIASINSALDSTEFQPVQEECKIDVAWDLDDCLIKSSGLPNSTDTPEDPSLNTTITHRLSLHEIVHVDDDLLRFKTKLRSFAHLVIGILQKFCRQHVFTSASKGYMINVVQLITDVLPNAFLPKRLSCTDFPPSHLTFGKDISELDVPSTSRGCLLVDDNARYHQTQPLRGLHIPKFQSIGEEDDDSLLPICISILKAAALGAQGKSIEPACINANTNQYWDDMVIARAFTLSRIYVENGGNVEDAASASVVVTEDTWPQENIGDTLWSPAVLRVGHKRSKRFVFGCSYWNKKIKKQNQAKEKGGATKTQTVFLGHFNS